MSQKKRPYLNDETLDQQLDQEGYVVIPFLEQDEVDQLVKVFKEAHKEDIVPFYATAHHPSSDFRKEMSNHIVEVLRPHASEVFNDCKLLGASFIVKSKDDASLLQPHQDWNIVDENEFRSFNVWIPLVDLTPENGAIEILPKSHNWLRGYRHSSIDCAYREVHDLVWENMKPLYMKAGEALIYDHALIHASKANTTDQKRIACASGVIPTKAPMYFYWNNNGTVEQYESNADFFMTENIFEGPGDLRKIADVDYGFHSINADEFYRLIGKQPPLTKQPEPIIEEVVEQEDALPFWKVYTPMNILREINNRLRS